jgi:hypothetical protein
MYYILKNLMRNFSMVLKKQRTPLASLLRIGKCGFISVADQATLS